MTARRLVASCWLLAALLLAPAATAQAAIYFKGKPSSIYDADTLTVAGKKIRLHGLDAPELKQTCRTATGAVYNCGQASRSALVSKIGALSVRCEQKDVDRYGRVIAICRLLLPGGATPSLNDWLVRQGLAVAYRQYSTAYVGAENEARLYKRGMWAGTFQMPWDWRASRTTSPTPSPSPRDPTCLIKGNISSAGKIYHVPGSAFYDRTDVDESKGERWFCTVEEAEAAGWRAPA